MKSEEFFTGHKKLQQFLLEFLDFFLMRPAIMNYALCIVNYSSPTQLAPLTLASLPQVSEACISLVSIVLSSHREDLHGF